MEVFSNIVLNLQAPAFATVFSPQGQTLSRSIQATLMDGTTPWEIPETALCIIRYAKPDGTKGFYDTLEDDSSAYSYNGNVVTFGLATQALTVPGTVLMQLDFYNSDGEKLSTFTFRLIVAEGVFADSDIASEDFINVLTAKLTEAAKVFADGEAEAQQFFDENTAEAQQIFNQIKQIYGAPWTAATAAAMTDTSRVYVYTGTTTETLTNGHWYYWDGTAWADGGVYNSTAFETDPTLTIAGAAADAKATGDAVEDLNRQISDIEENQIPDLKSAIVHLNFFDSHSSTQGYTRVQDGVFSPTEGYYDSNLIPCLPGTDFYIIIEKKLNGQALPEEYLPINFFNKSQTWISGNANYTHTATAIAAEDSIFGYGGFVYKFTTPKNEQIAYWSKYYSSDRWANFGMFCYYQTKNGNTRFTGDTPVSAIYFDRQIPKNVIAGLSDEIDSIKADTNMQIEVQSLYADWADFDLGYLDTSGQIVQPYANAYTSDYISVVPGSTVEYRLRVIGNSMYGLAWYNGEKVCLGGEKHTGDNGTWQYLNGTTTLPDTARYIRFSGRKLDATAEKSQYVTYTVYEKVVNYLAHAQGGQQWQGKKWVAFGTSITDTNNSLGEGGTSTGKYVPYLQKMSGMQVINKGIAGGAIGVVPDVLTGQIMNAIKSNDNLADIQAADIITIEGFVNDFVGNLPIGTIFDTENTTLMGALYEAITYLYSQNKDATIVLITESTGQYIDSSHWFPVTRNNALGKYQYEYNDAIITMAHYLGCHVIDAGQKSQINQWHTDYLADWIHHSELGGKQYAETIWDELKNIHCNSDVSVS